MAGPRSPTNAVTAQLTSRRWSCVSSRCYANFQQRSNERLIVLPQNTVQRLYTVEETFRLESMKLSKNNSTYGWVVLPQTRPSSFTVLRNLFVGMLDSDLKTIAFITGPRSPTSHVTARLISRRWRIVSVSLLADFENRSNERLVVLPQTRSSSFHGVEEVFRLDGVKLF